MTNTVVALIPAYKPEESLIKTIRELVLSKKFVHIVCVNDGSGQDFDCIFEHVDKIPQDQIKITILKHAVNLGKGNALKTGFNYIALNFPDCVGVVTLDADGQHLVDDCCRVAHTLIENPHSLVMGVRTFDSNKIPLRSRLGNIVTAQILKFFTSVNLRDTQTGLRGIPFSFLKDLLRLNTGGYDFELDMLILANAKNINVAQTPIKTLYFDGNSSSHFNPFLDSFKIYIIFLRFITASFITFLFANVLFFTSFYIGFEISTSIVITYTIGGSFNYWANKTFVFKEGKSYKSIPLYLCTLLFMAGASYLLVVGAVSIIGINVYFSKIFADLLLYFLSFTIQKNIVFKKK